MSFKAVELREEFYAEVEQLAQRDNKTVAEELEHFFSIAKEQAFREYCIEQIELGKEQINKGQYIDYNELKSRINQHRKTLSA